MSANRTAPAVVAALLAAAASLAPAAPLLAAVSLSISDTNGYHYVSIPTNMAASLTGQGMGATASTTYPLRYEDAAFLAEALAERYFIFDDIDSSDSTPYDTVTHKIYNNLGGRLFWYQALCQQRVGRKTRPYSRFIRQGLSPISSAALAKYYDAHKNSEPMYGDEFWVDIFQGDTNVFFRASLADQFIANGRSVVKTGDMLSAADIASLYSDVMKTSRAYTEGSAIAFGGSYKNMTKESYDYSTLIRGWNPDNDGFVYGEKNDGTPTNEVVSGNYKFSMSWDLHSVKRKSRCFEWDKDSEKYIDVTGDVSSYGLEEKLGRTIADVYVAPVIGFGRRPGMKVTDVMVFGLGDYSFSMTVESYGTNVEATNETAVASGTFVVNIPLLSFSASDPNVLAVKMGSATFNKAIADSVKGLFPEDPGYDSANDLLSHTQDAKNTLYYFSGGMLPLQNSSSIRLKREINITSFYAVYDVDFNARVKDGGE